MRNEADTRAELIDRRLEQVGLLEGAMETQGVELAQLRGAIIERGVRGEL